jgi:hypothetical protein
MTKAAEAATLYRLFYYFSPLLPEPGGSVVGDARTPFSIHPKMSIVLR